MNNNRGVQCCHFQHYSQSVHIYITSSINYRSI